MSQASAGGSSSPSSQQGSPRSRKKSRVPCVCSSCEPADGMTIKKARGICRSAGVGNSQLTGGCRLASVPVGPQRIALLKSLNMHNRFAMCTHSTEQEATQCGCTWGNLAYTTSPHHTINKAHFTPDQLTHAKNNNRVGLEAQAGRPRGRLHEHHPCASCLWFGHRQLQWRGLCINKTKQQVLNKYKTLSRKRLTLRLVVTPFL